MSRIIEWLNLNEHRRYPLQDDCSYAMQLSDGMTVSDALFNDGVLLDFKCVSYQQADYNIYFNYFDVESPVDGPKLFKPNFTIVSDVSSTSFTLEIPHNGAMPYKLSYTVANQYRIDTYFGEGILEYQIDGRYTFTDVPGIVRSLLLTQKDLRVNKIAGSYTGSIDLTDTVYFEAGSGISIRVEPSINTIYISAIPGAGTGFSCEVVDNTRKDSTYIKKINNLDPQPDGDISLAGGAGIAIIPDIANNKVVIQSKLRLDEIFCKD